MNSKNHSLQQGLQSIERGLKFLRQNLCQLSAQPDKLSEIIKQLSLVQSELQSVLEKLAQPSDELKPLLCHEFLTPLTLIQGSIQLLATGKFGSASEKAQSLLNVAFDQTNKLMRIVRELVIYQQIKSGQLRIVPQDCPAAELINSAAQRRDLKVRKVEVMFSVKPVFASVWADPEYIILLLSHLLSNAIKFAPTPSTVTLTARLTDLGTSKLVLFQIKDRGIGIAHDQLKKIFDCFYQVDHSDSRPYNGLGLGLALSHQIVQLHGGQLWAESILGGGSSFYFTLPVSSPARNWWVEIQTNNPQCTYYFGPFETSVAASDLQDGFLEDLRQEQAQIITVEIKQCQPEELTICVEGM